MTTDATIRIPPYSEDAERGVLGSMLLDPVNCIHKAISLRLEPVMFYDQRHQILFEHIIVMDGERTDAILIGQTLKDMGVLDKVGGYDYLIQLQDHTIVTGHIEMYAETVARKYRARKLIEHSSEAIDKAYKCEDPDLMSQKLIEDLEAGIPEASESMNDVIEAAWNESRAIANGEMVFLPFPWHNFQRQTFGIPTGAVTPLLGRDKTGKSRLAMEIVKNWALNGIPTLVFAFEDGKRRYIQALASTFGRYDSFTIRKQLSPIHMQTHLEKCRVWMDKLKSFPIFVIDESMTAEELAATIAAYKRKHGIKAVVIDGFKDVLASRGENRTGEENHIFETVKRAALRNDVGVLQIEHTHDVEDGKWLSKRNIRGSKQRSQSARMFLVYQDCGFPDAIRAKYGIIEGDGNIALDCQAASYGEKSVVILKPTLEEGAFHEIMAVSDEFNTGGTK